MVAHFIEKVKSIEDHFLIFDGHYSHVQNVEIISKTGINLVTIISLPPLSTHKQQLFNKTFMGSLKDR